MLLEAALGQIANNNEGDTTTTANTNNNNNRVDARSVHSEPNPRRARPGGKKKKRK
eukprot:CAMPEP_0113655674 /NCGR_PEP_ID=MMETSP0017_2-20120614/29853_1 /TAXON_ID=2856 /ORGANISM="Cylindrotheca closterium" /LENGTH=55 /DNA_ID=CAMNT_0000568979 /DNA_START=1 /DNA_END=165 /DNA_ORIENTATION=+ /assembly_acc=CAM_ASM_000147